MKKVYLSLFLAILTVVVFAAPALAWGGDSEADTDVNIVTTVNGERESGEIYRGDQIVVNTTITTTSHAEVDALLCVAGAESGAGISANGNSIGYDSEHDLDAGWTSAEADASRVYSFSYTTTASVNPEYIDIWGGATAWAAGLFTADYSQSYGYHPLVLEYSNEPHNYWDDTGKFQLVTQAAASMTSYPWEDAKSYGHVIGVDIDQSYHGLRVVIPAGTIVNEGKSCQPTFSVKYTEKYGLKFDPDDVTFSNPVTVYYNGVEIASFTEVKDGVAQ